MVAVLGLVLVLTIPVEDVTLPNGVRVVVSVDRAVRPPEVVVSRDRALVVIVGDVEPEAARAAYLGWPRPSPEPATAPPLLSSEGESWEVRDGPPSLLLEWPAPPGDELSLLLPALLGDGLFERRGPVWRFSALSPLSDGDARPAELRRRFDARLERWATPSPREVQVARETCGAWASPPSARLRAQRLLQVTLATGNPRRFRELGERCARLDAATLSSLSRSLSRRSRRVRLITPRHTRLDDRVSAP